MSPTGTETNPEVGRLRADLRQQHLFLGQLCEQLHGKLAEISKLAVGMAGPDRPAQPGEVVGCIRRTVGDLQGELLAIGDFARLEAGAIEFVHAEFDLHTAARTAVASQVQAAAARNVRLRCYVHCEVPRRVVGDELRVRQVISQTLANVLDHSADAELSVCVAVDSTLPGACVVRVTIGDGGVPAAATAAGPAAAATPASPVVGDPDWESPHLANLAHRLALMGGQLGVEASEERGCALWFTVALAARQEAERRSLVPQQPVLLVSNDAERIPQVTSTLQAHGFTVELERDYWRLPQRLQRSSHCLVLMDRGDAHVATFAVRSPLGSIRMMPMVGVPLLAGSENCVDQAALLELVQRWAKSGDRRRS